jgi:hypothetical protein
MKVRLGTAGACGVLACAGLLAGCATTFETSSPLGSYRYHYDSGVVYNTTPSVVYRDSTVTYREPVVTYREPVVTYTQPATTEPTVVYRYRSALRLDDDD